MEVLIPLFLLAVCVVIIRVKWGSLNVWDVALCVALGVLLVVAPFDSIGGGN
jgi:hypothetical protein